MKYSYCIFSCLVVAACLQAQPSTQNFDSLAIAKPKQSKTQYQTSDPRFPAIDLKWKKPNRSPHTGGQMAGDASRNLLTSIFGGRLSTSQSVDWLLATELTTHTDSLNWQVHLFCPGELEKESHRIRNDDGSHSLEKQKTAHLSWEKGTVGLLLEQQDTIGSFAVALLDADSPLTEAIRPIFDERDTRPSDPWAPNFHGAHYQLNGNFRGQELTLWYNGETNKGWIYLGGKLAALFQSDNEPYGYAPAVRLGKKYKAPPRLLPYLLYDKDFPLADALRLGMMSRIVAYSVSRDNWDY